MKHFLLILLLLSPLAAYSQEEDVDFLDLAALMLRDGNYDRALSVLDQVDLEDETLDRSRYYTLRGMTHFRRNELEPARDALSMAVDSGEVESLVHIYLAQIYFGLEQYQQTLDALDRAGEAVDRVPAVYHMRAQCHWLMEQPHKAIAVLDQASLVFPDEAGFKRRKVFYLIDMGLYQEAAELGRDFLSLNNDRVEDYVALGNALRASGQLDEALAFLEIAHLRFPANETVSKVLAHTYIDRGELNAAADLIYSVSHNSPELLAEAAELYRQTGQVYRALTLNGQLSDQPSKFKQRLALLLELGRFEQAAAMETPLYRVGLLEDEDIRYAVAYAHFKTGDYARSEEHLSVLTRSDLFRKATELRRAIQDCQGDAWKCY